MKRLFLLLLPLALLPACNAPKEVSYLDKTLPAEVRAADLLSKLTLEEKTALVQYESQAIPRLGIPAYNWWNEALHGVARNGSATVFPQPIGMAASFDTEKIEAVFTAVSDEARVKNREARESGTVGQYQGLTFWTPNINIFRDP
ncbi:MAG: glycoside hydrolase family 3 protein, partial [Bacteroidales bacterium]|nr:glycoside hydrolase family 3 protein [Bacteroidales bacterium]